MSSCTDLLQLNKKRFFQDIKSGLPSDIRETRNILEICDNIIFIWNPDKCCVFTLNISAIREKIEEDVPYQSLQPTDPPIFEVTNILINETMTQLVVWGNLGISLIKLPKRWGRDAVFDGGKELNLCSNYNFGDFGATTEIRRVRWHPGSTNDSHLLVLTSENSFRLYECELNGAPKLIKCWKVGRVPSSSPAKIPNFASLGETAVDFDFATPTLKPELFNDKKSMDEIKNMVDWDHIEWPILVLRGNGEIMIVRGNVLWKNYEDPIVFGALSMYPPTDDNYGIDSSSIMCLQTTPPIVIIAMCSGKIYHAILLRETINNDHSDDNEKNSSQCGLMYSLHTSNDALYVYECVELELGLLFMDDDQKYNCRINLHPDKSNKSRYFCSHNAGIHMVSMPMVSQLESYIHASNDDDENQLQSLPNQSTLQYLFSTRTKHTSIDEPTPILGFGFLQEPCVLIALPHTGIVVDFSVIDLHYLPRIEQIESIINTTKKAKKEAFDVYIKKLLKREVSQPITKIGSHSKSLNEYLELLYNATNIFRTQYFVQHDKVREEFNKKVRVLKSLKTHLLKELDTLMETKKELRQTAERLAEQYEDIKDKQKELARRAEEILRIVNYKEPSMTGAERAEAEELKKINTKISDMKIRIEQLKKKSAKQSEHLDVTEYNGKKKEIVFKSNQEEAIRENLEQMAKDIRNLMARTKQIKIEINLSYINKQ